MSGFQSNNLDAIKNVADSVRQIMQGSVAAANFPIVS